MNKEVILTGIRSNSIPTLGNYLGAFLPMVELQKKHTQHYQVNMFVPDLHSFTTPVDHDTLYQNSIQNLKFFVAAGLDIENEDTYIYRQSYIPAHSELTWILDCFVYVGEMSRMTQFKDKSDGQNDSVSAGLFNYPVLMVADILLYGARYVPVGEDQRQHLELARDLAQRMNNKFGELFVVPEDWTKQLGFATRDSGIRIRSLVNPEKKMSKSISDPRGTILLTDDPADAAKKVMGATTDSLEAIQFDMKERPGISNLLQMLALLSKRPLTEVITEWEGKSRYGELKQAVATVVETFLKDFQHTYAVIDETKLVNRLEQDEAAMRKVADATLLKVQQAVGLRPRP
jgi:tryptophanyl-tRNA synthetase